MIAARQSSFYQSRNEDTNLNQSIKTALIVVALAVVGCVGGLKMISLGIKYFMHGQILTGPGNDPVR
jgi:hypothetical protein